MDDSDDIRYHLPRRTGGQRMGAHRGTAAGAGMEFLAHLSLFDHPDPRRLDLRASLADLRGDWLGGGKPPPAAVTAQGAGGASGSMRFGQPAKLHLAAHFVEALALGAFRIGDAVGMLPFDAAV